MSKLPPRDVVKLARILADQPGATIEPKLAKLIGRPDKAWDAETERMTRAAMRGADNTDTE